MNKPEGMPLYVSLGLGIWGRKSRKAALGLERFGFVISLLLLAASVVLGFQVKMFESADLIPLSHPMEIFYTYLTALVAAVFIASTYWFSVAIRWMDNHSAWEKKAEKEV